MSTTVLYPPIVLDALPAFNYDDNSWKIYFAISDLTNIDDIQSIQYSIVNQKNNKSILKTQSNIAKGIRQITKPSNNNFIDTNITTDYKYYITLSKDDFVTEKGITFDTFFKIQLRFKDITENLSEWSKVCLLKWLKETPTVNLLNFDNNASNNLFSNPLLDIIGNVSFNSQDSEYLKSYRLQIYNILDNNNLVVDSGDIYTDTYTPNEINYSFEEELDDGGTYLLKFSYVTSNLYTNFKIYTFSLLSYGFDSLPVTVEAIAEDNNGRIKVSIVTSNNEDFLGTFTIRRASSKTNFHRWEDIHNITYSINTPINEIWYDYTVESGVFYHYCVQKRYSNGTRGTKTQTIIPIMCYFEDIFLNDNNKQLKIQFNPTIADFKYNVTESQQVTIGSQYPYIKRNSKNYYRTFNINGLISSFIDDDSWYNEYGELQNDQWTFKSNSEHLFTNKAEIYSDVKSYYDAYNQSHRISPYQDYIYEKNFRDKVYDFLYKNNIKLFRSTTQGNILVKLMNIAFQPIDSLGRRLYSFSATATEIDKSTLSNYLKYNIFNIDPYIEGTQHFTFNQTGQIYLNISTNSPTYTTINHNYLAINNISGYNASLQSYNSICLQIDSDPYLIDLQHITDSVIYDPTTNQPKDLNNLVLGYLIKINEEIIIIKATSAATLENQIEHQYQGYYELSEDNINNMSITSLQIYGNISFLLNYSANIQYIEQTETLPIKIEFIYNPSQLYQIVQPQESIINLIKRKYNYTEINQSNIIKNTLSGISEIEIETQNNAVVYIQDVYDTNYERHIVSNGYLALNEKITDAPSIIKDMYFNGIHMIQREDKNNNELLENEFKTQIIYIPINSISLENITNYISSPIHNICYIIYFGEPQLDNNEINNNELIIYPEQLEDNTLIFNFNNFSFIKYIYHNNQFYEMNQNNDMLCPIHVSINYCYGLEKREYNV